MMQEARKIVTQLEEKEKWYSCLRNFEMTCYGEHFTLVFWSGSRTNKMVIQTIEGEVIVSVTKESWLKWLKGLVEKCRISFKNVAFKLLEAIGPGIVIAGTVLKAIGI